MAVVLARSWLDIKAGFSFSSTSTFPITDSPSLKPSVSPPTLATMGKKTILGTLREMMAAVPPLMTADLTGKTAVVVGANTGIGFEAAKHFAEMNAAKVILACRSEERGNAAVSRLKNETGLNNAELRLLDLSKFSSVIAFADSFKDEERLDILVMNAAVGRFERELTEDGWEEGIQVNNLSTSLLTLLLTPKMEETAKLSGGNPRIVIVTSDLHFFSTFDEAVFDAPSSFRALSDDASKMSTRYQDTKLLNVFFMRSLASLLSHSPIIITAVNPGYCKSELRRHFSGIMLLLDRLMEWLLARTSEEGSRELVHGALAGSTSPEGVDKMKGAYISNGKTEEPADYVLGDEGKRRGDKLWADLIRELSKVDGWVVDIVRRYSAST